MRVPFLFVVTCLAGLVGSPVSAENGRTKKVVRATFLSTRIWQGDEPGSYAKLVESMYSPEGSRIESGDGSYSVEDTNKRARYNIYPDRKVVQRLDFLPADKLEKHEVADFMRQLQGFFAALGGRVPKPKSHRGTLRGYPCAVTVTDIRLKDIRVRSEEWKSRIGGHELTLRSVTQSYKGGTLTDMYQTELVQIDILPKAPTGMLAIPAEYEVQTIKMDDIRNMMRKGMAEQRKDTNKR